MTKHKLPISRQLMGIHHVGITVEDMAKALEFYIDVLGGQLFVTNENISGDQIQNTLLQKEELDAQIVPDLRSGKHLLDIHFIQFENLIIELVQYREAQYPSKGAIPFNARHAQETPAHLNSMHISFYVSSEVDMDAFAAQLEEECHKRNMTKVTCNRTVKVKTREELMKLDPSKNSCKFDGDFEGFSMFYCKGPNGEQLEFNQVRNPAHKIFVKAQQGFHR